MNFIPCQLAVATKQLRQGTNWVAEAKYDGYRTQVHLTNVGPKIYTRGGLNWTERLRAALPSSGPTELRGSVLDGEVCVLDGDGRPDFSRLGQSLARGNATLVYFAFDLLVDGHELITHLPLLERKARLSRVITTLATPHIHYVEHTLNGALLINRLRKARWEGVMMKDGTSPYLPGVRSPAWRKLKFNRRQEFVVAGWRQDATTGGVKSIVLGTMEDNTLTLRGSVGSGFGRDERIHLANRFAAAPAALSSLSDADCAVNWLQPRFVAEIEFLELTPDGCVRGASYLGLREDKPAANVYLELPMTDVHAA